MVGTLLDTDLRVSELVSWPVTSPVQRHTFMRCMTASEIYN
jgi:hypothetical protein